MLLGFPKALRPWGRHLYLVPKRLLLLLLLLLLFLQRNNGWSANGRARASSSCEHSGESGGGTSAADAFCNLPLQVHHIGVQLLAVAAEGRIY